MDDNLAVEHALIRVRLAVPGDEAVIAAVLQEAFAEYEPLYTHEAFAATTPTSDQVRSRFADGPAWVALHNGTVVGTVAAVPTGDALYVRSMAVLPSARGLRLGQMLLEHMESFASKHSCKRLFLSTTPFLSRAISLYERCGFRRSEEGPHELLGTPLFTMVKDLPLIPSP